MLCQSSNSILKGLLRSDTRASQKPFYLTEPIDSLPFLFLFLLTPLPFLLLFLPFLFPHPFSLHFFRFDSASVVPFSHSLYLSKTLLYFFFCLIFHFVLSFRFKKNFTSSRRRKHDGKKNENKKNKKKKNFLFT